MSFLRNCYFIAHPPCLALIHSAPRTANAVLHHRARTIRPREPGLLEPNRLLSGVVYRAIRGVLGIFGPVHATTLTVAIEFGALVVSTIGWPGLRPDPSGGSAE